MSPGSTSSIERITAIVLAAGKSTRMGRPKQLLTWGGKPLLQHVVDTAARSPVDELVVVLGAAADEVMASLDLPPRVRIEINPDYELGQATSLRVGLGAAKDAHAALILLGDEPDMRLDAINLVLKRWQDCGRAIIRPTYSGRPGHPVLLARETWEEILVSGDEGARSLMQRRPELVDDMPVPFERPSDVDTPDDFVELSRGSALPEA